MMMPNAFLYQCKDNEFFFLSHDNSTKKTQMRQINNFLKTFDMGFYLWHGFCIMNR